LEIAVSSCAEMKVDRVPDCEVFSLTGKNPLRGKVNAAPRFRSNIPCDAVLSQGPSDLR
jgi:hypothetical protein